MGKIIKKGTLVQFEGCCDISGTDRVFCNFTLDEDTDIDELNQEAYEHAIETFQPEGWCEILSEPGDE